MSEIELYSKLNNPIEAVKELGLVFSNCGMFQNCDRAESGQMLALICYSEQKSPTYIMNNFHILSDGKLSRKTGSADADFRRRGGTVEWIKHGMESDQDEISRYAEGKFTYEGQSVTVRFSMVDAERAKLLRAGSAWEKMPWKMLRARVISEALSMLCPEIYYEDENDFDSGKAPREIKLDEGATPPEQPAATPAEPTKKPKPKPKPKPKAEPEPIEAEVIENEPEPEAVKEPAAPLSENPNPKTLLPEGTVKQIEGIIFEQLGEATPKAGKWMIAQGWLKAGETFDHLEAQHAHNIIKYPKQFANRVKKEVGA